MNHRDYILIKKIISELVVAMTVVRHDLSKVMCEQRFQFLVTLL